jgi:hypothetical protein
MCSAETQERHYAIKRLQADKGTWYWFVKFSRCGEPYERRFYDPKHGGAGAALAAAIKWRDGMLAKIKVLRMIDFCQQQRSNNTSGTPGVHFLRPKAQPHGIWQARLKLADGTCETKTFAVLKHGERKAFALALAARKAMLRRADNRAYVYDPLAKHFADQQQVGRWTTR